MTRPGRSRHPSLARLRPRAASISQDAHMCPCKGAQVIRACAVGTATGRKGGGARIGRPGAPCKAVGASNHSHMEVRCRRAPQCRAIGGPVGRAALRLEPGRATCRSRAAQDADARRAQFGRAWNLRVNRQDRMGRTCEHGRRAEPVSMPKHKPPFFFTVRSHSLVPVTFTVQWSTGTRPGGWACGLVTIGPAGIGTAPAGRRHSLRPGAWAAGPGAAACDLRCRSQHTPSPFEAHWPHMERALLPFGSP